MAVVGMLTKRVDGVACSTLRLPEPERWRLGRHQDNSSERQRIALRIQSIALLSICVFGFGLHQRQRVRKKDMEVVRA